MRLLWLDDVRDPHAWSVYWPVCAAEVLWARDRAEFSTMLSPLPDAVSFDHDIGDDGNGLDCARLLADACMQADADLPVWSVHSANPVGAENIRCLLRTYERLRGTDTKETKIFKR